MYQSNRRDITGKLCFLILCQLLLIYVLAREAVTSDQMIQDYKEPPASMQIVLCRFLCAIFLHIHLSDELDQSFSLMKYAMNHQWRFRKWYAAFFVGFAQMFVTMWVEVVNLAVLLTNNTCLDIIMNFLALVIISEFDDYFFNSLRREPIQDLIAQGEMEIQGSVIKLQNILRIQTTTSARARHPVEGNKILKDGDNAEGVVNSSNQQEILFQHLEKSNTTKKHSNDDY